jgi:hypothetical protein
MRCFSSFSIPLCVVPLVFATKLDIVGRASVSNYDSTTRRSVDISTFGNGSTSLSSKQDISYFCNITLGGTEFEVLIDTGRYVAAKLMFPLQMLTVLYVSSDLWVSGDVPGAKNLSIPVGVKYASGSASGFISTAELDFDDFIVEDQAFSAYFFR